MPDNSTVNAQAEDNAPPSLSVPEGGKVTGYGETFRANEFSGAAGFSVPIHATECARGNPEYALRYTSGGGNGPFGLGMSLDLPAFSRRTSAGIPKYEDGDVFLYSAGKVLTPCYALIANKWVKQERKQALDGISYRVVEYRPRVESDFMRIEFWIDPNTGYSFWKTIDAKNTTAFHGRTENSRIFDPADPRLIFQWLIDESIDAHGNRVRYTYKPENADGLPAAIYNQNRDNRANRYPERILYGNYLNSLGEEAFALEIRFDYGEYRIPDLSPAGAWPARADCFSSYRSGFEIRTNRLCRSILMIHHCAELGAAPTLVSATTLEYEETPAASLLRAYRRTGYRLAQAVYLSQSLPPARLSYTAFDPSGGTFQTLQVEGQPIPGLLDSATYSLVDLYGEGLPGILNGNLDSLYYWPGQGGGRYGPANPLPELPSDRKEPLRAALVDIDGNGHLDLVVGEAQRGGFYQNNNNGSWMPYRDFATYPPEFASPSAQMTDLDGDGRADLLVNAGRMLRYYLSRGQEGYESPVMRLKEPGLPLGESANEVTLTTSADMFGDGLSHRVRVSDGKVEVWPNTGYGRFGEKILMGNAPHFPSNLAAKRILLASVSGLGAADLLIVENDHLDLYVNQSGNSFAPPVRIEIPFRVDDLDQLNIGDVTGTGGACLVVSKAGAPVVHHYLDFWAGRKPYLLRSVANGMGLHTEITYRSSTEYFLADRASGRPWVTRLSSPVQVVARTESTDQISGTRAVRVFQYRDGYYDPVEREFRGFGSVQTQDGESYNPHVWHFPSSRKAPSPDDELVPQEPAFTKAWNHTGAFIENAVISKAFSASYWHEDPDQIELPDSAFEKTILESGVATVREAYRALADVFIRHELFGIDNNGAPSSAPYQVTEANYTVRMLQPRIDGHQAVFLVLMRERAQSNYEKEAGDPRIHHELWLESDPYGFPALTADAFYKRRPALGPGVLVGQGLKVTARRRTYATLRTNEVNLLGEPSLDCQLELQCPPPSARYYEFSALFTQVKLALADEILYGVPFTPDAVQSRPYRWTQTLYWSEQLDKPLPPGEISPAALVYQVGSAVFSDRSIEQVYGTRVSAAMLRRYGYKPDGEYWWDSGNTSIYNKPAAFYLLQQSIDPLGNATQYHYDAAYALALVGVTDPLGQEESAEIDYHLLVPRALRSVNDNTSEVLFDPLGNVLATSLHGTKNGIFTGNMPLAQYVRQAPATLQQILDDPGRYLQGASEFYFYKLDSALEPGGQPAHFLKLTRNDWLHPPAGDRPVPSVAPDALVGYLDGSLRTLVSLTQVEAEALPEKDRPDGGGPLAWIASGQVKYNNRSEVIRRYLPCANASFAYAPEPPVSYFSYRLDALGRAIQSRTPHKYETRTAYTAWAAAHYDEEDTDPDSPFRDTPEIASLNSQGLTIQKTRINVVQSQGVPIKEALETYHVLDIAGNSLRIIDPRFYDPAHPDVASSYAFIDAYDMRSRKCSSISMDAGSSLQLLSATDFTVVQWNASGFEITTAYDALGRKASTSVSGNGLSQATELFEYGSDPERNNRNQVTLRRDQAGIARPLRYDLLGNMCVSEQQVLENYKTEVNWNVPANVPLLPDVWTMQAQYDATGRMRVETSADGSVVEHHVFRNGWLRELAAFFTQDAAATSVARNIRYAADGSPREQTCGEDIESRWEYDPLSLRLRSSKAYAGRRPDDLLQDLGYLYDRVGNVTGVAAGTETPRQYGYNAIYQLLQATGRQQAGAGGCTAAQSLGTASEPYTQTYTYDRAGNLTTLTQTAASGNYVCGMKVSASSNRAVPENILNGNTPDDFFDASGNQISLAPLAAGQRLSYDYRSRLSCTPTGTPERLVYALYDSAAVRVRKVLEDAGEAVADTLYIGNLVLERAANGTQSRSLVLRINGQLTLVSRVNAQSVRKERYQLADRISSVTLELSADAEILTYEEYFPFGRTAIAGGEETDLAEKRYRYNGKELDPASSLYYYGQRYYASWQYRWLTPDPAGAVDGLNLYAFVNNNPLTNIDIDGLCGDKPKSAPASKTNWYVFGGAVALGIALTFPVARTRLLAVAKPKAPALPPPLPVTVFRFATEADPTSIQSNLSKSSYLTQWRVRLFLQSPRYRVWRAEQHARGDTTDSPFVSVITDPTKLANSTDPWARTIATGKPGHPGAKPAPDLATFSVPPEKLIVPKNPLSQKETEQVFLGDNLGDFNTKWIKNPFIV